MKISHLATISIREIVHCIICEFPRCACHGVLDLRFCNDWLIYRCFFTAIWLLCYLLCHVTWTPHLCPPYPCGRFMTLVLVLNTYLEWSILLGCLDFPRMPCCIRVYYSLGMIREVKKIMQWIFTSVLNFQESS